MCGDFVRRILNGAQKNFVGTNGGIHFGGWFLLENSKPKLSFDSLKEFMQVANRRVESRLDVGCLDFEGFSLPSICNGR